MSRLERYLDAIRTCPDRIVSIDPQADAPHSDWLHAAEYGVVDGLGIHLHAEHAVVQKLVHDGMRVFHREKSADAETWYALSQEGTVQVDAQFRRAAHVFPYAGHPALAAGIPQRDYLQEITIRTIQARRSALNPHRALANALLLFGDLAKNKGLPICFPQSCGTGHVGEHSRMIYSPD